MRAAVTGRGGAPAVPRPNGSTATGRAESPIDKPRCPPKQPNPLTSLEWPTFERLAARSPRGPDPHDSQAAAASIRVTRPAAPSCSWRRWRRRTARAHRRRLARGSDDRPHARTSSRRGARDLVARRTGAPRPRRRCLRSGGPREHDATVPRLGMREGAAALLGFGNRLRTGAVRRRCGERRCAGSSPGQRARARSACR
jgi:hypothetical protein